MIIVTGGAGFIGSNLVRALNDAGRDDILVVDDLSDGTKFVNLVDCAIRDYMDKEEFLRRIEAGERLVGSNGALFHQGACSTTTEWDGRYMMNNNYEYSKRLLEYCVERSVPFLYASSAAVYGLQREFCEDPANERPLNVYGYSKLLFDQYVRRILPLSKTQIAGFRYFNVYGPREQHKGSMASVAFHLYNQIRESGHVRLFEGCDGYGDGEQRRDFIHVEDVCAVNLWFLEHPAQSGIFNLGTGRSRSFNEVARAVIDFHGGGEIEYIPFPEQLRGRYQSYTEADVSALREAGYDRPFMDVREGVRSYLEWLAGDGTG